MRAYRGQVSGDAIYRQHAGVYARFCEHSLPNAAYDRPAILRLAGDVAAQMYRRPISAIFSQLRGAGFTVDTVDEPQPEAAGDTGNPEVMQILQTQPVFLFIRALRARA